VAPLVLRADPEFRSTTPSPQRLRSEPALTAAAVAAASVLIGAPAASADTAATVHEVGDRDDLVNGAVVQGWTITDLEVSMDSIPYAAKGTLWGSHGH
jgi:hypothetical protein